MKIITATAQTQGQRDNDFHWCVEGEVVTPVLMVCQKDQDDPDGGCGCGRSWSGANSHGATTTAMVRDLPLSVEDYTEAIQSSLQASGWYPKYVTDESIDALVRDLAELADSYPVGAILETRLGIAARRGSAS